jgi:hypothetical protein
LTLDSTVTPPRILIRGIEGEGSKAEDRGIYKLTDRQLVICFINMATAKKTEAELTDEYFDRGYPRDFYDEPTQMVKIEKKSGVMPLTYRFVRVGDPPTSVTQTSPGGTPKRGDFHESRIVLDKDQFGKLQFGGMVVWSNDLLPLLYGVPKDIQSKMPASQLKLVSTTEKLVKDASDKLPTFLDSTDPFKFRNDIAREEFERWLREQSKEVCQSLTALDGWIGQWRKDPFSTAVLVGFGKPSYWASHVGQYPHAKDPKYAYCSYDMGPFCQIRISGVSPDAKQTLASLQDGDWVRVYGESARPYISNSNANSIGGTESLVSFAKYHGKDRCWPVQIGAVQIEFKGEARIERVEK